MAGPKILESGADEVSFPTWAGTTETMIYAESLESGQKARVRIQAGGAEGRSFETAPGGKGNTSGKFGGLKVRVINENGVKVKVWTI